MARLTMAQAYALARQAGFDPASALIAAAIGMAESGLNTAARGDLSLQTDYWGPSVGLMQIRTVKSQTGTGGDRDIQRVSDPQQNLIAAYDISHKGKDFSAWTTYNNGAFRQFLGQSAAAANAPTQTTQVSWLGDLTPDSLGDKVKGIMLLLLAVAAGGGLIVLGGYQTVGSPKPPKALAGVLL